MADVTMCQDRECPNFATCYRAQAKPNEYRQSYRDFQREGDKCMYYAPMQWSDSTSALRSDDDR